MILEKLVWEISGNGNKMRWLVGTPGFRQVRAARRRNTLLLYESYIPPWRGFFKDISGSKRRTAYKELEALMF